MDAGNERGGLPTVPSYNKLDQQHPPAFLKGYASLLANPAGNLPPWTRLLPAFLALVAAVAAVQAGAVGAIDPVVIAPLALVLVLVLLIKERHKPTTLLVDFEVTNMNPHPTDDLTPYAPSRAVAPCSNARFVDSLRASQCFDQSSMEFQEKVSARSGLGDGTFLPRGLFMSDEQAEGFAKDPVNHRHVPAQSIDNARDEFLNLVVPTCRRLLARYASNKYPSQFVAAPDAPGSPLDGVPRIPLIGAIITNCSLFTPTPSLSAMLLNALQLPNGAHVRTFSLGGMGCSAGLIAIDLADQLLQAATLRGEVLRVLVVSTENITQNIYYGDTKCMLLPNCLFRCGAACILLSNEPRTTVAGSAWRTGRMLLRTACACAATVAAAAAHLFVRSATTARVLHATPMLFAPRTGPSDDALALYALRHAIVRTNLAKDDKAYRCVWQGVDDAGNLGIRLERNLMAAAGKAMSRNITELGPLVLPWAEQLRYLFSLAALWFEKARASEEKDEAGLLAAKQKKVVVPDFTLAFRHFCIHCGGRGVLDEVEKQLRLGAGTMAASRLTLERFGNTSSSSVWYSLACHESGMSTDGPSGAGRGVRRGDVVWQLGFGSGFKANSAVWVAKRDILRVHGAWA